MTIIRHAFGYLFAFAGFCLGSVGVWAIRISAWLLDHENVLAHQLERNK